MDSPIILLRGAQLQAFLAYMQQIVEANRTGIAGPYSLRIAIDEGAVKLKVDNHGWTRPLGEVETPSSRICQCNQR